MDNDREEEIRRRAHEIWVREGQPDGGLLLKQLAGAKNQRAGNLHSNPL
jgi:hypothetical protein